MAQNRVDNIQVNAPKDIDNKRGVWSGSTWRPYNNITEAVNSIPIEIRYRSLTVPIFKDGVPTDYYWRDGKADNQLVEKTVSGTNYVLPRATLSTLGGIIVGTGLYIDEETGTLSATEGGGGGGTGTVTSVGLNSTDFTVTNSPIQTSGSIVANIKNSAVTFAKMQNVPSGVLIGRGGAGTGTMGAITVGSGLELNSSNVLSSTGGGGGGSQTLQQTLNLGRIGDRMQITESLQIPTTVPSEINAGDIWIGAGTSGGGGGGGGGGTVTNVAMTSTDFNITGSPINTSGTIVANIKDGGVTFAKMQTVAQGVLVGRGGAGTGALGAVTIGSGLTLSTGNVLSSSSGSGTVTSVAMTTPTGLTVAGSPITSSGTLALTLTSGYSIPTTTKQTQWDAGYSHSQVTNSNPHATTLQQILNLGRVGDSMQITTSMQIPTVAPSGGAGAGSIWVGTGTSASSITKSKVNSLVDSTSTSLTIGSAQASAYLVATNASVIAATITSGTALTSVFVRQGDVGKVTFTGSGVTVLVKSGKSARTEGQNAVVEIFYETTTRVIITGDLDI